MTISCSEAHKYQNKASKLLFLQFQAELIPKTTNIPQISSFCIKSKTANIKATCTHVMLLSIFYFKLLACSKNLLRTSRNRSYFLFLSHFSLNLCLLRVNFYSPGDFFNFVPLILFKLKPV